LSQDWVLSEASTKVAVLFLRSLRVYRRPCERSLDWLGDVRYGVCFEVPKAWIMRAKESV
jgi:hypothetical protein